MLQNIYNTLLFKLATSFSVRKKLSKAHRYFLRSAELGNPLSQYRVGMNYYLGNGCLRSGSEALFWFERSSLAGNVDAQFELGVALLQDRDENWCVGSAAPWVLSHGKDYDARQTTFFPGGISLNKDEDKAFYWIKNAAEGGKPQAQANLGWLYMKGIGCTADATAAERWLAAAAFSEIPSAMFGLAELYKGACGHLVNEDLAFMWLEKAADLGHVSAMYNLARFYQSAGTSLSREKSVHYFTLASNKSHVVASVELAKLLLQNGDGDGIEIAEEKLRFAAKSGSIEAPLILGQLYFDGGVHQTDFKEALSWFKISAARGSVAAQFRVACMYAQGRGVTKDLSRAVQTFIQCALAGHGLAAFNLGVFYENGDGVVLSKNEAVRWYSKAVDAGVVEAKVRLARILLVRGNERSERGLIRELLESAASTGSSDAELALARLLLDEIVEGNIDPRAPQLLRSAASKGNFAAAVFLLSSVMKGQISSEEVPFIIKILVELASSGSVHAQLHLAELYDRGVVVPKSSEFVEKWLLLASTNFSASPEVLRSVANFKLGVYYCKRNLFPDDIKRGLDCYVAAGNEGHALSQYNLGIMYLNGIGVSCDVELAVHWLAKFVDQGHSLDQSLLNRIEALGYAGVDLAAGLPSTDL